MKRDLFPEVDFGEMLISTRYPGASPEDVELKVTNKIEKEVKEVTGIQRYMSFSFENVSIVHIRIDPDESDQERVKRDIRDAVNRVTDFPQEVTESPLITELNTSIFPVIEVGLSGDLSYSELRELARQFEKKLEDLH
ncbi:MAG: efflux RND transporter permease subunit, partial [Planctomycetes bacterium]|nr:efflux RND transporter permease subunit [Planctomycetota bacterium]